MKTADIAPYLFTESGLAALHSFADHSTLFAFDLDGTLAPIIDNPGEILIPELILKELTILNNHAKLAIITGRSRGDAQHHLGFSPRYLIGNHGAEGLPGWKASDKEFLRFGNNWERQLNAMIPVATRSDVVIENKGATVSIHYRKARDKEAVHLMLLRTIELLVPRPRRVSGIYVENLIPSTAPDKGIAILHLMQHSGCVKGFFAGDDETDEDVFKLAGDNLFTVHVGNDGKTRARYLLYDQREIERLLKEINFSFEVMIGQDKRKEGPYVRDEINKQK